MNLENALEESFCLTSEIIVPDEFIQNNPDLMWIKEKIDLIVYVPSYMLWCLKNREAGGHLVCDYTINALAEYGRSKDKENTHMNFKHLCDVEQKAMVYHFLKWCEANLEFIDEKQLQRTLNRWA